MVWRTRRASNPRARCFKPLLYLLSYWSSWGRSLRETHYLQAWAGRSSAAAPPCPMQCVVQPVVDGGMEAIPYGGNCALRGMLFGFFKP